MRDKALYFPYINIPSSNWIYYTLLYWDKLYSIVPLDYFENPDEMTPFMHRLVIEELVEMVQPGSYLYSIPNFGEPLLKYFEDRIRKRSKRIKHNLNNYSLVHIEKFHPIKEDLEKQKIIIHHNGPWYLMQTWAAGVFMTYLACLLGSLEDVNAAPVTNDNMTINTLVGRDIHYGPTLRHRERNVRLSFLEELFPLPEEGISIESLRRFKSKHSNLLSSLRNYIERKTIEISAIKDDDRFNEVTKLARKEIKEQINTITEAMKSHWSKVTFTQITPIVSAISGIGAVFDIKQPYSGILAASSALVSAMYTAIHNKHDIMNSPLAYAAMWHKNYG